jgi:hypothetical protein
MGNLTLCHGQHVACQLHVGWACIRDNTFDVLIHTHDITYNMPFYVTQYVLHYRL